MTQTTPLSWRTVLHGENCQITPRNFYVRDETHVLEGLNALAGKKCQKTTSVLQVLGKSVLTEDTEKGLEIRGLVEPTDLFEEFLPELFYWSLSGGSLEISSSEGHILLQNVSGGIRCIAPPWSLVIEEVDPETEGEIESSSEEETEDEDNTSAPVRES